MNTLKIEKQIIIYDTDIQYYVLIVILNYTFYSKKKKKSLLYLD